MPGANSRQRGLFFNITLNNTSIKNNPLTLEPPPYDENVICRTISGLDLYRRARVQHKDLVSYPPSPSSWTKLEPPLLVFRNRRKGHFCFSSNNLSIRMVRSIPADQLSRLLIIYDRRKHRNNGAQTPSSTRSTRRRWANRPPLSRRRTSPRVPSVRFGCVSCPDCLLLNDFSKPVLLSVQFANTHSSSRAAGICDHCPVGVRTIQDIPYHCSILHGCLEKHWYHIEIERLFQTRGRKTLHSFCTISIQKLWCVWMFHFAVAKALPSLASPLSLYAQPLLL